MTQGDTIEIDAGTVHGTGGTSSHVRASPRWSAPAPRTRSPRTVSRSPSGTVAGGRERQSRRRHLRRDPERERDASAAPLSFDGVDDIVHRPRRLRVPPDNRDDARGLGEADGRHRPGAASSSRRATRARHTGCTPTATQDRPAVFLGGQTGVSGPVGARRESLDAPRGHVRRRDAAPVRERRRRRLAPRWTASCPLATARSVFAANHVWGERFRGLHRRDPRLQPCSEPGRDRHWGHDPLGRTRHSRNPRLILLRTQSDRSQRRSSGRSSPAPLLLTPNGRVAAWDGFEAGSQLRADMGSGHRSVHWNPYWAQPVPRLRGHPRLTGGCWSSAATKTPTSASRTTTSTTRSRARGRAGRT